MSSVDDLIVWLLLKQKLCNQYDMQNKKSRVAQVTVAFAFFCWRRVEDVHEANEGAMDYVQQVVLFSKRAELAAINREIDELDKAKEAIASDYASADAQMMLAEVSDRAIGLYSIIVHVFQNKKRGHQHRPVADEKYCEPTANAQRHRHVGK